MPRKSTIICPQRGPKGWSEMLCGDRVTCDAIVKRTSKDYILRAVKKASRVGRPPLTPATAGHHKSHPNRNRNGSTIRNFSNKPVRAVWDNDKSGWWYSAVDFIDILVEPNSPRRYWNNIKERNPELSPFCGQLKLYADDGKKYLSDVIDESGVRALLTIIPSKYRKQVQDWISGMLDPIDEQSKKKAYELYKTDLIEENEIGKTIGLQKIHAYLFEGLYPFAGKIRTKRWSVDCQRK